ncbi:TetR/AcrR family transcriptional regulator [Ideonella sp.]|uniref:TetR/AcrR family transcriptional regulator n=1 Tax=Ideonella sp. TaxID=1929293 RepID=UPI0035B4ECF1
MARPRSAGYDDQRDQILAKASALFAQQGYTATSMNQVAAACDLSKAALYHYVRDKHALLALVAEAHVKRLEAVVEEVLAQPLAPEARLRELIVRFVREYSNAQNEHRVLTEDVKFLADAERESVLGIERRVVNAFAEAVAAVRPALKPAELHKPLTMLLFGMINWMFTWLKPAEDGQRLTHEQMAPMVAELFFGGLGAVSVPVPPEPVSPSRKKTPRKETAL